MARFLRQNTATIVTVGPFFDKTDGVTLETGLTITNERISFTVDLNDGNAPTLVLDNVTGATSGTSNDLNYIANCDAGLMQLELSAANTNYVGRAFLTITDAANHVPVFHEFTILTANAYDALLGTGVGVRADVQGVLASADGVSGFSKNVKQILPFTVTNVGLTPSATQFETASITEATANHFIDRLVLFDAPSALAGKVLRVNAYSLESGRGRFTVTDKGEAPANGDTGIIV